MPVGLFLPGPGPYNARNPERGSAAVAAAAVLPGYQTYALSLGPALYWALNAVTQGTDQSGNGRHGTGVGGISTGGFAGSPLNGGSTSTDFDNADDYEYATYSVFGSAGDMSFSGWGYRDNSAAADTLVSGHTSGFTVAMGGT